MPAPAKYRTEYCGTAEEILATGKSLAAVCAALDISRQSLYDWKDAHEEFKEAIERGLQKAQAVWEQIGEDGVKGHYEKFGGAPWIFTMKNRFRADYKEDKDTSKTESLVERLLLGKLAE